MYNTLNEQLCTCDSAPISCDGIRRSGIMGWVHRYGRLVRGTGFKKFGAAWAVHASKTCFPAAFHGEQEHRLGWCPVCFPSVLRRARAPSEVDGRTVVEAVAGVG